MPWTVTSPVPFTGTCDLVTNEYGNFTHLPETAAENRCTAVCAETLKATARAAIAMRNLII